MMTPQQLAELRAAAKAARATLTGAELGDLVAAADLLRDALRHFDGAAAGEWSAAARSLLGVPVPPAETGPSWADAPADATVLLKNRRAGGGFAWATEYAPNARFTVAAPGVQVVGELLPDHWDVVGWRGATVCRATVAVPEALAHRIAARVTLNPDPNANYCACCGQDLRALAEFRELVQ